MGDFLIIYQFFQTQYFNIHKYIGRRVQQQGYRQVIHHNDRARHRIEQQQYRQCYQYNGHNQIKPVIANPGPNHIDGKYQ